MAEVTREIWDRATGLGLIYADVNPMASGLAAPVGMMSIDRTAGAVYMKIGAAATAWGQLAAGAGFLPLSGGPLNPGASLNVPGLLEAGTAAFGARPTVGGVTVALSTDAPVAHGHALTDATITGILPTAKGGTGVDNSSGGTAGTVFARPAAAGGAATFRALVASDVPTLDAAKIGTGRLIVDRLPTTVAYTDAANTFNTRQRIVHAPADGSYTSANLEIYVSSTTSPTYGPRLAFHYGGLASVNLSLESANTLSLWNGSSTAYASFRAGSYAIGTSVVISSASVLQNVTASADILTSGTLLDARLSSNVPLKNAANVFTRTQTILGGDALVILETLNSAPEPDMPQFQARHNGNAVELFSMRGPMRFGISGNGVPPATTVFALAANSITASVAATFSAAATFNAGAFALAESRFSAGPFTDPAAGVSYDAKFGGAGNGIVVRGLSKFLANVEGGDFVLGTGAGGGGGDPQFLPLSGGTLTGPLTVTGTFTAHGAVTLFARPTVGGVTVALTTDIATPATHTHPWADIVGPPVFTTRWPAFSEVTGTAALAQLPVIPWAKLDGTTLPAFATRWPTFAEVTGTTFVPLTNVENVFTRKQSVQGSDVLVFLETINSSAGGAPTQFQARHNFAAVEMLNTRGVLRLGGGVGGTGGVTALELSGSTGAKFLMPATFDGNAALGPTVTATATLWRELTSGTNNRMRWYRHLAFFQRDAVSTTGAIVIKTTILAETHNVMASIRLRGFNYSSTASNLDLTINGYLFSNQANPAQFANGSYCSYGSWQPQVRMLIAPDGYWCIVLGDVATVHSYPWLTVAEAGLGWAAQDVHAEGWTTALVTDLAGYLAPSGSTPPNRTDVPWANVSGKPSTLVYTDAANVFTTIQMIERTGVNIAALGARITGDTTARWTVYAGGRMEWGPGGALARDTFLYRSAVGTLHTDGKLSIGGDADAADFVLGTGAGTPGGAQFLPLSGGTITGTLTVQGAFTAQAGASFGARPTVGGVNVALVTDVATPATHTHTWADITSGVPVFALRWPAFSEVTGTATAAQIPALDAGKITSGTFDAARIPTLDIATKTSGTLPVSRGGTGATSVTARHVFMGPTAAGAPTFRAFTWADIASGHPDFATRWPTFAEVTAKPTTFEDAGLAGGTLSAALTMQGGAKLETATDGVSSRIQSYASRTLFLNELGNTVRVGGHLHAASTSYFAGGATFAGMVEMQNGTGVPLRHSLLSQPGNYYTEWVMDNPVGGVIRLKLNQMNAGILYPNAIVIDRGAVTFGYSATAPDFILS